MQIDVPPDVIADDVIDKGGYVYRDALALERGNGRANFEEIGVVAHFPELHEDVYHAQEVAAGQSLSRPATSFYVTGLHDKRKGYLLCARHVIVVKVSLPL